MGFPGEPVIKNPHANAGDIRGAGSNHGWGRFPGEGQWQPTPVFLPRKFHGQTSLGAGRVVATIQGIAKSWT